MTTASIHVENAKVLDNKVLPENQYLLRLHSPQCAQTVKPGNFIQLSCSTNPYSLKRPFSVMRASAEQGWLEVLYKVVGNGTQELAKAKNDDVLQSLGPIGNQFSLSSTNALPLLLGGGVGIPPIIFFAEQLLKTKQATPMVIMGSEIPFPFKVMPSSKLIHGMPSEATAAMALFEDLGIPSRLTSKQGYPGCYDGYIHELAGHWLESLDNDQLSSVEVFACGPDLMLEAVAKLSQTYDLKCQLSLEEYMACAVGGCAGCTVPITQNGKTSMQRVCVDGPIFDANAVYPE